jgi:geranylgeranyl diphosphate synthase, type II
LIERKLAAFVPKRLPVTVYEPIRYTLQSGGKRLRAVLVLLSCEAVCGKAARAVDAALAVELLHNFTLIHDDVMDHAELRRGKPAVHRKWDENVAILSGDECLAQAFRLLLKTPSTRLPAIASVYTDALVQVCEGQGYDKEFESRKRVTEAEYFSMIAQKTGRVISASLEIGALIGGGTPSQVKKLRTFGEEIGRAFQVKDDLLDLIGDPDEFGKRIGGDILEGKKTYLLVRALAKASGTDAVLLKSIAPGNPALARRIGRIRSVYESLGVMDDARTEIRRSTARARRALRGFPPTPAASMLQWLGDRLLERNS